MSNAAVTRDGKMESLSVERTELVAEHVNGGVIVNKESFVLCAFSDAADAESKGNGDGDEEAVSSLRVVAIDAPFVMRTAGARETQNWSRRASVVVRVTAKVCASVSRCAMLGLPRGMCFPCRGTNNRIPV